jgi:hypothetical protein
MSSSEIFRITVNCFPFLMGEDQTEGDEVTDLYVEIIGSDLGLICTPL